MAETALERMRRLAAQPAAAPVAPAAAPQESALERMRRLASSPTAPPAEVPSPAADMAAMVERNAPWLAGDTTPAYGLSQPDQARMVALGQELQDNAARRERVATMVEQIRARGGVPKPVLAAQGMIESSQAGLENAADVGMIYEKDGILPAAGALGRTMLGTLPFVPAREASPEAQEAAYAMRVAADEQTANDFGDKLTMGAGNLGGVIYGLRSAGLPVSGAIKGYRAIKGIDQAADLSKLAKYGKSAAEFGLYNAMPSIESGEPVEALKDFGKGAAVGAALHGATKLGEAIPGVSPWLGRPALQTVPLAGQRVLETGELPSGRDLAADFILNAATQGVPQRALPEALRRSPPKVDDSPSSKLRPVSDATREKFSKQAIGPVDPATGAILSPEPAGPPVGNIESQMHPIGWRERLGVANKVDPATGTTISGAPESIPDPSYKSMLEGKRPVYLDPTTMPTASELAFREAGAAVPAHGVQQVRTEAGTFHFDPNKLQTWLNSSRQRRWEPLVVRDGPKIDFDATIKNFEKADRLGALLEYGEGNASKVGATHTVTGYDANGKEITTILAKNVKGAEDALKTKHGAASVEVKPLEQGVPEVIAGRAAQQLQTQQPTSEPISGQQQVTKGTAPMVPRRSREGGFINLSILTGKKKSLAEQQAAEEIDTVDTRRKWTQIQHADVAAKDNDLFMAGTKAMAAHNAAVRKGGVFAEKLWESLGNDPKMVDLWTRYLIHQNARAEQAKGKNVGEHLFMPHEDYLTVRENREMFNEAEKVTREFSDAMSEYRDVTGIKGRRSVEDVPYFRLTSIHTPELRKEVGARAARAKLPSGYLASKEFMEGTADPSTRGSGGVGPYNRGQFRQSGSAKTATGQSDTYAIEPFTMAMEMLRSHELPARHNQFVEAMRSRAVPESEAKEAGLQTEYNGKKVKLVKINVAKRPDWMPDKESPEFMDEAEAAREVAKAEESLYVPEPVAKFWEDYVAPGAHAPPSKFDKVAKFPTDLSLATTFGDSSVQVMHGLSVASRISGYGKGVWQKAVQRYGGIGRFLGAIQSVDEFNSPESQRWHKLLTETGSLRPQEMGPQSEANSWKAPEKWLATFIPPAHKMTSAVFDVGGIMDRQRVSWARALEMTHPELTDAQIVWTVQNLGGSFVKALQPVWVRNMPRSIAPFVQMGVTKARNAVQQVAGRKPEAAVLPPGERKWSAEQLTRYPLAKATSIGAAWLLANAIGDDETLEETLQHVGYTKIDGRLYPIEKFLDPSTSATSRLFGVNNFVSSMAKGEPTSDAAQNALRAPLNYAAGYIGPLPQAATIAATGRIPFVTRNGMLLRAFPASDAPLQDRAKAVGSALLPGVEEQFTGKIDDPEMSMRRQVLERILNMFGAASKPDYGARK